MNLKHTHHRINTLIIDLNRISVINNNHTQFRQDKLRQFEKCYQSKHLLKEDCAIFVADLWNNENTKMKSKLKLYTKLRFVFFCFSHVYIIP